MQEPKQFDVDGITYFVNAFRTSEGMRVLTEIVTLVGEPIVQFVGQAKKGALDTEIKPDNISSIMAGLTSRLHEDSVNSLFKKILQNTFKSHTGQPLAAVYETEFIGKYSTLFKVVYKSIEAQYGDFFGVLGDFAKPVK